MVVQNLWLAKILVLLGLLRQSSIKVPAIRCIIHQEALLGKILKLDGIMNTVFKITNLIRGSNHSLNHRSFIEYLEKLECD